MRRSDDPEHEGHLARLYREVGRVDDGTRHAASARARFEALLRRHPAAFADHAARFFLEVEGDAARASELALQNLSIRRTADAVELALGATSAADAPRRACPVALEVAARSDAAPRLRELVQLRCSP